MIWKPHVSGQQDEILQEEKILNYARAGWSQLISFNTAYNPYPCVCKTKSDQGTIKEHIFSEIYTSSTHLALV